LYRSRAGSVAKSNSIEKSSWPNDEPIQTKPHQNNWTPAARHKILRIRIPCNPSRATQTTAASTWERQSPDWRSSPTAPRSVFVAQPSGCARRLGQCSQRRPLMVGALLVNRSRRAGAIHPSNWSRRAGPVRRAAPQLATMFNVLRSRTGTACPARFFVLNRASFPASIPTSTGFVQVTYSFRPVSTSSVPFLYHVCPDAQLFSPLSRVNLTRERKN